MRQLILVWTIGLVLASACWVPVFAGERFLRGEADGDGRVDFSDMISILVFVLLGGEAPACEDAADVNDDGNLDFTDAIFGLTFLILGGEAPPAPGPFTAGFDGTPIDRYPCGDNTPPASRFIAQPETGQAPLEVTFDATSSTDPDGEIATYEWDFGDGQQGTGATITHTFATSGAYTVNLSVIDESGATASTSTGILVTPSAPDVLLPESPTRADLVTLDGSTGAGFLLQVVRQQDNAITESTASETGLFSVDVALQANTVNRFFLTVTDPDGQTSPPTRVSVINDSEPPLLFVDEPAPGSTVTNEAVTIIGRVSDRLSGHGGLDVTVNGLPATVLPGIGTNGTFELSNVALALGVNTIALESRDILGNTSVQEHQVTRVAIPEGAPTITVIGGNNQSGQVASTLPAPVIVELTDSFGDPFSGKIATFEITRSDGSLSPGPEADTKHSRILQARTDAAGLARVYWTLGSDAGCGNNRLSVTSNSMVGTATVCATATAAPPNRILVGSGNNQRVETGAVTTEPLRIWASDGWNASPGVPITFTVTSGSGTFESEEVVVVEGRETLTVPTTETGHAEVLFRLGHEPGNHVVEADFAGNAGRPASFVSFGVVRDESQPTSFSGVVVDNSQQPIEGARCDLALPGHPLETTTTDEAGHFVFPDLPAAGPASVFVDGLVATRVGGTAGRDVSIGSFPALSYDIVLVPNAANGLPTPVRLPRLDPVNAQTYDGSADVFLGIVGVDGLAMVVKAGSVTLPGGRRPGPDSPATLALNQVHRDDIPMPMPDGASPPFAWTLQPAGATFDPPVEIIYPNMSALPPGAVAFFLNFDHDTGRFETVASGQVTSDGTAIVSDPGVGLRKAGWGASFPPASETGNVENCAGGCDDNDPCTEDTCVDNKCVHTPYDGTGSGADGECAECENMSDCRLSLCEVCDNGRCVPMTVTISGPNEVCVDGAIQLTADATPAGGAFTWTRISGLAANITGSNMNPVVTVQAGPDPSVSKGDVEFRVTYNMDGISCANETFRVSVVKLELLEENPRAPPATPLRVAVSGTIIDTNHPLRVVVSPTLGLTNISVRSQAGRLSISTLQRTLNIFRFRIKGAQASLNPGDERLVVTHPTSGCRIEHPVTVIKPYQLQATNLIGAMPQPVVQNMGLGPNTSPAFHGLSPGYVALATVWVRWLTIEVFDQFCDPIGNFYAGAQITEGGMRINQQLTAASTYTDPVGLFELEPNLSPVLEDSQAAIDWINDPQELELMPNAPVTQDYDIAVDGIELQTGVVKREIIPAPPKPGAIISNDFHIVWPRGLGLCP